MRVFVTGTGTDVGKTHVTASLLAFGRTRGRVLGWKPVASGVEGRAEDAEAHALAAGVPYLEPEFTYRAPLSPHLAARREGISVDMKRIAARADELEDGVDVLFIEGAGGLFSPLSELETQVDLLHALSPALVLVVASDRLGVLHDVRATTLAARLSGAPCDVVVLSSPASADASTGTNAAELARIGVKGVAGVFPRAAFDAPESLAVAERVWSALRLSPRYETSVSPGE